MTSEKVGRKEKNQNIQVFVRLRPLNQRERDIRSLGVVEVVNNREVVVKQSQQTNLTKKFTFDRAFGPYAKQVEVYQHVVSPLIEEVLAGYNCTVFAYGQTGTGKTHTMVGEHFGDETSWQDDPLAGIIPRALSQLFDELRISNTEYTVRVSYLELYNEELFDLLSTSEDNSKLRIYEDVTRKGSNIVNGLEEITVYNKNEVYKIMAQGQERKRVASTLMNAQSSRSHTVFTIVVHMKENSPEGEELVKIGKLNLVDLAGSENISKAGSDNPAKKERARECVNINQSLLTLGRVITALVERHPHIPYRESKLTRILQESLGGRTKTSIIATISPGHKDLEETMSTLEYAHRAKNIQNKPEINQKMTKKAILKEFAEEIDRLKRDLQAARDKTGVYLANETYAEMTLKQEEQRKEIQELLLKKRAMEEEKEKMEQVFSELREQMERTHSDLNQTKEQLQNTTTKLMDTDKKLRSTWQQCAEQKHLVEVQHSTEQQLARQARALLGAADAAAGHALRLHDAVDRRRAVEAHGAQAVRAALALGAQQRAHVSVAAAAFCDRLAASLAPLHAHLDNFVTCCTNAHGQNKTKLEDLVKNLLTATDELKQSTQSTNDSVWSTHSLQQERVEALTEARSKALKCFLEEFLQTLSGALKNTEQVLTRGDIVNFVKQWEAGAAERVRSVREAAGRWAGECARRDAAGQDAAAAARLWRREATGAAARRARLRAAQIEEEKSKLESRLSKQLEDLEEERKENKDRLDARLQEERALFEQRMARLAADTQAREERLSKKIQEIEEERRLLEERMRCQLEWQDQQVTESEEELMRAGELFDQYNSEADEAKKCHDNFAKELDNGTSAVSIDLEVFTKNISEVTEHIVSEISRMLTEAQLLAEGGAERLRAADAAARQSQAAEWRAAAEQLCSRATRATACSLRAIQELTGTASEAVQSVVESLESVNAATLELSSCQVTVETAKHQVEEFVSDLKETVACMASVEERYLVNEYKQYSPSGGTPGRVQYEYPRQLAATSPHERILRRFRESHAAAAAAGDLDCVVIESEEEDTETQQPQPQWRGGSPEGDRAPAASPAIFKSTSESDLYVRRKQQEQPGKENTDHSISYKRPSKLPAPTSLKKPLVEWNN